MNKAVSQRYQQPAGIQGQVSLKSDADYQALAQKWADEDEINAEIDTNLDEDFWEWEQSNMQEKITQENRQQSATVNNA